MEEVDFVIETLDGRAIPVEVKFHQTTEPRDVDSVRRFMARYRSPFGIVVTRDLFYCEEDEPVICVPVLDFLLAFWCRSAGPEHAPDHLRVAAVHHA